MSNLCNDDNYIRLLANVYCAKVKVDNDMFEEVSNKVFNMLKNILKDENAESLDEIEDIIEKYSIDKA